MLRNVIVSERSPGIGAWGSEGQVSPPRTWLKPRSQLPVVANDIRDPLNDLGAMAFKAEVIHHGQEKFVL
jgi:hypothetical protein